MKKKLGKKMHTNSEMEDIVPFHTDDLSDLESSNNISTPSKVEIFSNMHKFMKEQMIKHDKSNEVISSYSNEKLYEDRYDNNSIDIYVFF